MPGNRIPTVQAVSGSGVSARAVEYRHLLRGWGGGDEESRPRRALFPIGREIRARSLIQPSRHLLRRGVRSASGLARGSAPLQAEGVKQHEVYSIHRLAMCYEKGTGVPLDRRQAKELYELAASLDFEPSQKKLSAWAE